jgi:hypothetical protein
MFCLKCNETINQRNKKGGVNGEVDESTIRRGVLYFAIDDVKCVQQRGAG